jgi:DNA segregation ATPase FtsK/SpoIIIE-like protein
VRGSGEDALFTHRSEVPEATYKRAVDLVVEEDRCSQAMLQRSLGISFSEANTIIERMCDEGKVGPALASGRREVLAGKTDALEQSGG